MTSVLIAKIIALDKKLNSHLVAFRKLWLLKITRIVTWLGSGAFLATVYVFIFFFCQRALRPFVIALVVAELAGLLMVIALRYLTRRERPRADFTARILAPWNRYSFPSLHTARMFMLTVMVGTHYRELFLFMLSVAIVICFTRIYLERHYLSDVLAGVAIGCIAAVVSLSINV